MNCKENCLNCEECPYRYGEASILLVDETTEVSGFKELDEIDEIEFVCQLFKDKDKFIELPCKVGDTIYDISEFINNVNCPEIYEIYVDEIIVMDTKGLFCVSDVSFTKECFGKTLFLTKEEAEKSVEKLNQEGKQ